MDKKIPMNKVVVAVIIVVWPVRLFWDNLFTNLLINYLLSTGGLNHLFGLLSPKRMAEIIALPFIASVVLKEIKLGAGFYSFCNYSLLQALADIDHGAD